MTLYAFIMGAATGGATVTWLLAYRVVRKAQGAPDEPR